jgi:hypothetical protein
VADDDQRAIESLQHILQLLDRGQIEMVGRLVQQQEERRLRTGEAAGGPAPRSAAKAASATRANAADRQSVAALELAQDEIRSGRDDGPLVPMTRAA